MSNRDEERLRDKNTPSRVDHRGRDRAEPGDQPGEFADDMRAIRDNPPPDPQQKSDD